MIAQTLYGEFINFFKKQGLYDEKMFNYIRENSTIIDYRDKEKRDQIGYHFYAPNNIIKNIQICVPMISDKKTLLINIYVYMHAIQLYKQIGKKFDRQMNGRALPLLYEKIYLQENPNEELEEYLRTLDKYTIEQGENEDKIALGVQNKLLEYYENKNPNFEELQKKAKKLIRRHTSK